MFVSMGKIEKARGGPEGEGALTSWRWIEASAPEANPIQVNETASFGARLVVGVTAGVAHVTGKTSVARKETHL